MINNSCNFARAQGEVKRNATAPGRNTTFAPGSMPVNSGPPRPESPDESLVFSKAIVREVARIRERTSERQAERVGTQLTNFLAWWGDGPLEAITTKVLDRYQRHRAATRKRVNKGVGDKRERVEAQCGTHISPSTITREVQSIIRLLKENGFLVIRPAPLIGKASLGRPFSRKELKAFFDACVSYPAEDPGRYTPLFLLLLATGARPAEIIPSERSEHVALLKREIDYDNGVVTIRSAKVRAGRRSKVSRIQVAPEVLEQVRAAAARNPGVHIFPPMTLNCIFNRILQRAGVMQVDELGEKLTAHSFRHTFGTMLAEQGANAFVIQNVLRHSDPKMTARYVERATTAAVIDVTDLIMAKAG